MTRRAMRFAAQLLVAGSIFTSAAVAQKPEGSATATVLPPVLGRGAPQSWQVVSIPVPPGFLRAATSTLTMDMERDFALPGPRVRTLAGTTGRHMISITIGIPAGALAGRVRVAEARFSAPGRKDVIRPVDVDVSVVRQVLLIARKETVRARAGSRVVIGYDVINGGNVSEVVDAVLAGPAKWSEKPLASKRLLLEPGHTHPQQAAILIPRASGSGSFFLKLRLASGARVRGEASLRLDVLEGPAAGTRAGPEIVTSITRAGGRAGRAATAVSARVQGPLFDSVNVSARFSRQLSGGNDFSPALTRLGAPPVLTSVVLTAPYGRIALGAAATSLSELTGVYLYGRGGVLEANGRGWRLLGLGAASVHGREGPDLPLTGIRGELDVHGVRVVSSASHLRESGHSPRSLDAASVGMEVRGPLRSTLAGEFAHRRFQGGSGAGWSGEIARANGTNTTLMRVVHAPGGSSAFARATDEMTGSINQRLSSRASVSASGWRTSDATATFTELSARGWSIRPKYSAGAISIAVEARGSGYNTRQRETSPGLPMGFGRDEQAAGINVNASAHGLYIGGSAYKGTETRTLARQSGSPITHKAPFVNSSITAGHAGRAGRVEVDARIDQTRDAGGFVRDHRSLGFRGDRSIGGAAQGGPRFDWDARLQSGHATRGTTTIAAGLSVPLPSGITVRFSVERNPIFRSYGGGPLLYGTRIERSARIPMLRAPASSGHVYRDLNGNGSRDAAEPGVSAAVIRRGAVSATTDARGRYRLAGDLRQAVTVDEASLPPGWLPSVQASGDVRLEGRASAELRFVIPSRSILGAGGFDLRAARIIARDKAGREWVARISAPATATFDDLPVGTYTLEFEMSGMPEPLAPRGDVGPLVILAGQQKIITIILESRPLRVWRPNNNVTGGVPR